MLRPFLSILQRGTKRIVTLKNHASIRKETIKLVKSADKEAERGE